MHAVTFLILGAIFAVALAEGQYYVPRAYYTIDAEGHETAPVPLRRLRRSLNPYPYAYQGGANANANAEAQANGENGANANANANAHASATSRGWGSGSGAWGLPSGTFGSTNPKLLSFGMTRRQSGPVSGHTVNASTSVGVDSSGRGYYDQSSSVSK